MCFTATASFAAGAVLTTAGVASLIKRQNNSQLMFSAIPFLFAVQQFAEGFVWLAMDEPGSAALHYSTQVFLIFALAVWPSWVPLSMLAMEQHKPRKTILGIISGIGIVFSLLAVYYLIFYTSQAVATPNHVQYRLDVPDGVNASLGLVYLIPTVASHFISSDKRIAIIGSLILVSHILTVIFYKDNLLSVWCFFSALISALVYFIVSDRRRVSQLAGK